MILNIVRRAYSPPGTGGVAAPLRKRREATEAAQTGWSDRRAHVFAELTTPAAPLKEASRHFLDGASTPPVPGGEYARLIFQALSTRDDCRRGRRHRRDSNQSPARLPTLRNPPGAGSPRVLADPGPANPDEPYAQV